jgi:hypothetical protein
MSDNVIPLRSELYARAETIRRCAASVSGRDNNTLKASYLTAQDIMQILQMIEKRLTEKRVTEP